MLRTKREVDRHVRELLSKVKNENDRKSRGYNIARLYYSISEYESARRYLSEFISAQPKSPEGHKLLGHIYEKLGQKDKAVASFKTSYSISNTQKDLVLKICELYADLNVDATLRAHWADEGEKMFPHHNSVVKLKQSIMLTNPSHSKEEMESFYLKEIKVNPLSLSLHIKLSKLYLEWAKEDSGKYEDAFNYVIKVEARRPFPHSLEWYQAMIEVLKAYENWKKPKDDEKFEELFLSILDRYVFESLASSCGPALSALCSPREAAQRLQEFDMRLVKALKFLGRDSVCGRHMMAEFYFNVALLISLLSKSESILLKDIYLGCLLLHAVFLPGKEVKPHAVGSDDSENIKNHWYSLGHYRVSQAGHMLNQLAHAYRGQKHYLNKIQETCMNEHTKKHIYSLVFKSPANECNSLLTDDSFMQAELTFVDKKTQLLCDQSVTLSYSHDLRELVWLYNQYSSPTATNIVGKFFNFHFFRSLPFAASMNTFAPETLCHLDLVAFIVATAYCQKTNADVCEDAVGTSCPSILAVYLHTPEQGEWWNAAASLCSNMGGKRLNRLRSILQNGLESVRHIGHHVLPLHLTIHLAKYFTNSISEARNEGNSANEIESLEEMAEHYWSKVIGHCRRSAKGTFSSPKSRLFEVRRCDLSESELEEISEEGELFIADRLVVKGRREEAIQILARLKSPRAAFNRAMLYKKEAQSLLGNRTWHSLNLNARNNYISLLTQSRDALYLTLDRLKMPGEEPSDSLNRDLSEELTRVEHSLATVTLEDYSDDHSDADGLGDVASTPRGEFHPSLGLVNGNASTTSHWGSQTYNNITTNLFSTPTSTTRTERQEARPSPERLDAQVRHLTELQQNTIKNIEEYNAALRAQNEALLHTCQTMSAEFKENVAFYRSFMEQKNADADHITPILEQLKQLQGCIKGLHLEVQSLSSEVTELRNMRMTQNKPEPIQLVPTSSSAAPDNQVPIEMASPAMQGVYNNYMGFYGQQPVVSPLVAPSAIFNPCQPPFMPPSTLQDQAYMPTTTNTLKSETSGTPILPTSIYQPSALNLKAAQSKASKEDLSAVGPPHSYQISLPTTSSIAFSSVPQTLAATSSETSFNTEGLLSSVPAPLYSAITTNQSPDKGATRNLLASTLSSTPVTHSTSGLDSSTTPTFGQWPSSSANFPPGPSSVELQSSPAVKLSPVKSVNDSDHYVDDGHDPCPDFKPIIPLPAQVEVYTGEEEEKVLFEGRAKLFRFLDKEWKERGLGPLKILHNESQNTVRVLMRRDQTHKICCNHLITPAIELTTMADNDKVWVWAAQDFADEKLTLEKFCCKFKTVEMAQDFQKAFNKGKMITETAVEKAKMEVTPLKITDVKPLSETFKPEPGSWTCNVCLLSNKKESVSCAACQSPKPGETKPNKVASSAATVSTASTESKVAFKFGIQSPSLNTSSSSSTLTFLGDKTNVTPAFSFGIPTSKPTITIGVPSTTVSLVSGNASFASGTTVFGSNASTTTFTSNTQLTLGPSASVIISPVKPGSAPSISLFKTTPIAATAPFTSINATENRVSSTQSVIVVTPTKTETGGKFSLEGFTFSSEPTLAPPKTKDDVAPVQPLEKSEVKKDSIFSNFSFTSSKTSTDDGSKEIFSINLPSTVTSASNTVTSASSALPTAKTSESSGGLFSGANTGNALSFSSVAASEDAGKTIFTVKDSKAFQPKPLFGTKDSSGSPSAKTGVGEGANTSKEDTEDYEPQIDFKPVVPMPDLVEMKTGEEEEEKLFCERSKLYRYDGQAKEWKERGVGEMKLLKNIASGKIRVLMRRDQTFKICANHFLSVDMKLTNMPNSEKAWVWAASDFADEEMKPEKFAIRFKNQELANKFKIAFEEAQKSLAAAAASPAPLLQEAPKTDEVSSTTDDSNLNKPLSELFKVSAGSWECSACLVVNEPNVSSCVACCTPKNGEISASEPSKETSSVFGGTTAFPFKSASSNTFAFGVPASSTTSTTSSSSNITTTATTSTSTFTFGFKTVSSTTTANTASVTATSAATSSTQPFNLNWKSISVSTSSTEPLSEENKAVITTPVKAPTATEFKFGSPGKYEFSFSGVKSPRSRDTSTCESEGGTAQDDEAEEEEDNLYFEPVIPLPDKIEVVTGEEDEEVLYSHRAKLYRHKDDQFKERGLGDVKILAHKQTGKVRLLMRREQVHKICLNHYLTKEMEFRSKDEKSFYWVTTDYSEGEPSRETFAIRFKTPEIASSFAAAIKEAQANLGKPPVPGSGKPAIKSDATTDTTTTTSTTTPTFSFPSTVSADTGKSTNFGVFGAAPMTSTPKSQFSFGDKNFAASNLNKDSFDSSTSGSELNEVEIVYEKKAAPEEVERARNLQLPDNFFLYEQAEPCPGCMGCSSEDLVFKKVPVIKESVTDSKEAFTFVPTTRFSTSPSPSLEFKASAPSSLSKPTFSFGSQSITSSSSAGNLFGGSSIDSESGSLFGGASSQGTGSSFWNVSSTPSIFGGRQLSASSGSIFGGTKLSTPTTTTTQATGSIFGSPASGNIFGGTTTTTSSIFGGQLSSASSGSIFGGKPSSTSTTTTTTTTSIFGGGQVTSPSTVFDTFKTGTSVTNTQTTQNEKKSGNSPFGQQAVLSFSDMAKQMTDSTFGQTKPTNPAAWVTKPVFAKSSDSPKSPDKDSSLVDEEYDPHYEPVVPMPQLIKVTTGEEGWENIFSSRSKVYRYDQPTKQWKERGIGEFKIQFEPNLNKYRFLQRREQVHKLSCNHYLTGNLELEPMESSEVAWCWLANDFSEKQEGEIMKLAVKFKTKEIAMEFKKAFDSCRSKILATLGSNPAPIPSSVDGSKQASAVVSSSTADGETTKAPQDYTATAEDDDDEYEDVSTTDETEDEVEETEEENADDEENLEDEDDEEDENEEDYDEQTIIFSEECELHLQQEDKMWQSLGTADLRICYDDEAFGARIIALSKEGERVVDNLIAIQTTYIVDNLSVSWISLDELEQYPTKKVHLKATFENKTAVDNFISAFNEGKEYACSSGIEETYRNDVPKELLYYGQASED